MAGTEHQRLWQAQNTNDDGQLGLLAQLAIDTGAINRETTPVVVLAQWQRPNQLHKHAARM